MDLEMEVATQKVNGVSGDDLRKAIRDRFMSGKVNIPIYGDIKMFAEMSLFSAVLDEAAFAAQCAIRKANGLPVPDHT